ncbi:MAG: hypothetical protein IAE83_15135 [Anaerolinea sp.]|nr:hypothetical protein [Anaerolinea sp.]
MLNLALVGMAIRCGGFADLDNFTNALYEGLAPAPEPFAPVDLGALVAEALADAAKRGDSDTALAISAESLPEAILQARAILNEGGTGIVVIAAQGEYGTGAVALRRADQAHSPYARLTGLATMPTEALREAGLAPSQIGYLELSRLIPESRVELGALAPAYQHSDLSCGMGGGFGGIVGLIRAALCLYQRFIPAIPGWKAPAYPELWSGTPFYTTADSKAWFAEAAQGGVRHAGVSLEGSHLILSETPHKVAPANIALQRGSPYLFLLNGGDASTMLMALDQLERALHESTELAPLAKQYFDHYRVTLNSTPFTLAIIGRHIDELRKEINLARAGIPEAFQRRTAWSTPGGSAFTATPLRGEVAFVYPGAFSAYPRMGQDLFHLFPRLWDDLGEATSDLGRSVGDRSLYARGLEKQSTRQWREFREKLEASPANMMEAGMTFAALVTRIVKDTFKIAPQRAFGYSLGEACMMWGMGVWKDGDAGSLDLHTSPLWDRLYRTKQTVREVWGVPASAPDDFWSVYFIAASAEEVLPLIAKESRVYLTHINTPREVTIAGDTAACKRIVTALGREHLHAPFGMVMHCEPAVPDYPHFLKLHDRPLYDRPEGVTFYASADYAPTVLDRSVLGHNISRAAVKMLDFPRLIQQVYRDGARIFIELGARNACARWVTETLGEREHLSVSINQPSVDDRTGIVRMLAKLAVQRVPMDLSLLFESAQAQPSAIPVVQSEAHQAHQNYLESRLAGLRELSSTIQTQINTLRSGGSVPAPVVSASPLPPPPAPVIAGPPARPALFDEAAIHEFALGSVVKCFGEEYRIYENRRAPRIPNGDLLLVSRVTEMHGKRHELAGGSRTVSEYDMPAAPWFFRDNAQPGIPYSVYMEMALQLCGFLSAYLGSTLTFPDLDFYFRNLDGDGRLTRDLDLRGKTITNHVEMLSSITMKGIILQKFTFDLSADGQSFYKGGASFGCFTAEAMANQVGLDKGKPVPTWLENSGRRVAPLDLNALKQARPGKPHYRLSSNQLDFIDEARFVPDGGKYGKGYIYALENVDPADWFFTNHFHQDPVMPGSLGVEAILQSMQALALTLDLGAQFRSPRFRQAENHHTIWRYRGQVIRKNKTIWMEVHVKDIMRTPDRVTVIGDASLWRDDGLRIYEVQDAAISLVEG